ncbi:tRNA pseudouridine(55) synthase TruB [Trichothermofontia sp.]
MTSIGFDGFLNLNKPLGWTSHDCVAKVRRLLRQKRVGHGGTLDPAASGVLPIALGKATRLLSFLPAGKAYRATFLLGLTTTTDDLEGEILSTLHDSPAGMQRDAQMCSPRSLTLADIQTALTAFQGPITQVPPRYSAIQVDGKRLYDRARAGEEFEVPERTVTIEAIEILDWRSVSPVTQSKIQNLKSKIESLAAYPDIPWPDLRELELNIICGPGTYIRAIARDLGAALGTGGTLATLVRTESCGFSLATSLPLDDLANQLTAGIFQPLPMSTALQHLPAIVLPLPLAKRWCQGQKLPIATLNEQVAIPAMAGGIAPVGIRVEEAGGRVLGVGEIRAGNSLPSPDPQCPYLVAKVVLLGPGELTD